MLKRDTTTGNTPGENFCFYYLHTNGELIHKPKSYDASSFEESDFVVVWWKINLDYRVDAYNMLVGARLRGANEQRIQELIDKWQITNRDAENYINVVGLQWFTDGPAFFVAEPDFINIQESDCGSGNTLFDAIADFYKCKVAPGITRVSNDAQSKR